MFKGNINKFYRFICLDIWLKYKRIISLYLLVYLFKSKLLFFSAFCLVLSLNSCQQLPTQEIVPKVSVSDERGANVSPSVILDNPEQIIWSDNFKSLNWQQKWKIRAKNNWGLENTKIIPDPTNKFENILRVHYPAGSASPTVHRQHNVPLGGAGFYAQLGISDANALRLSYYLRFSENFNFVKGGKLPGLFGGEGGSGGKIPNGTDGFSTRFMWRKHGDGEIYAYLPTSSQHGTSIGRGNWGFRPNQWYLLEQEVVLNDSGLANGHVRVWLDGKRVLDRGGLIFRQVNQLTIDGIFFSTFFGGGDPSWATPQDVYIDFADFAVLTVKSKD